MKLAIIGGAGLLGSTTAFRVSMLDVVDEIVLIDIKENMVKSHAMDMGQAISEYNQTSIKAGTWHDLENSDIVLLSASMPETNVKSRLEYLEANIKIIQSVCRNIKDYCPQTVIVNATNPVDAINHAILDFTGIDKNHLIGFCRNDTLRMKWSIAKVIGINTTDVEAICIGEHGEKQVPLFSQVKIKGEPFTLNEEQKSKVLYETSNWFTNYQALNSGRTSGWTSALGLARLIQCIATDSNEILPCSVVLQGEYGLRDVSVGVPVRIGPNGVKEIVELEISEKERAGLYDAADKIRRLKAEFIR